MNAPSDPSGSDTALIDRALAAVDAANAADPNRLGNRPLAQVQGERASAWLQRLDPHASPALRIAVRAHHLGRWTIPRADYPDGRGGYLRWRRDLKQVHAAAVAEVLAPLGLHPATVERVQQLVQKVGLGTDPDTQTFEDAVCLVFLETQFDDLADRLHDDDKMVAVLRKTAPKMSAAARALAAAAAPHHARGRELLERALREPT